MSELRSHILAKLARVVPLVVAISLITFALLHLAPGGPVGFVTGNPKVTGEDILRIREIYGLDRPLPVQYLCWFKQVFLKLDFGRSFVNGRPVSRMIAERIPATLELMGAAFLIGIVAGTIMGVLSALTKDRPVDQILSGIAVAGISVPVFWTGIMAIYLFSLKLHIFPAGGRELLGGGGSLIDRIRHIVLPASVLSFAYIASWSRYLRASLVAAFEGGFIRTARAKGLRERSVILKHALKNALLPVITVMVMHVPTLFTGAVITETVFSWPGMGRLFYEGMQRQDYPRVLGIVVVSSMLIILFNLAGDILCFTIDPRIKAGKFAAAGRPER